MSCLGWPDTGTAPIPHEWCGPQSTLGTITVHTCGAAYSHTVVYVVTHDAAVPAPVPPPLPLLDLPLPPPKVPWEAFVHRAKPVSCVAPRPAPQARSRLPHRHVDFKRNARPRT